VIHSQISAFGPTLPNGSDGSDGIIVGNLSDGPDGLNAGKYQLYLYYYILSATSTNSITIICSLSVSAQGQDIWSTEVSPSTVGNSYSFLQQTVDIVDPNGTLESDLSCLLSSDVGQYSASVLIDDVYFFGTYVQCGGQQR
jgi:hypothetical protein